MPQRLTASGRPRELSALLSRHNKTNIPNIDLKTFVPSLQAWYRLNQPTWRIADADSPIFSQTLPVDAEWGTLRSGGGAGIFLLIMGVSWWIKKVGPTWPADLVLLVEDLTWVLSHTSAPEVPRAIAKRKRGRKSLVVVDDDEDDEADTDMEMMNSDNHDDPKSLAGDDAKKLNTNVEEEEDEDEEDVEEEKVKRPVKKARKAKGDNEGAKVKGSKAKGEEAKSDGETKGEGEKGVKATGAKARGAKLKAAKPKAGTAKGREPAPRKGKVEKAADVGGDEDNGGEASSAVGRSRSGRKVKP